MTAAIRCSTTAKRASAGDATDNGVLVEAAADQLREGQPGSPPLRVQIIGEADGSPNRHTPFYASYLVRWR